jgi:hypothetical protein
VSVTPPFLCLVLTRLDRCDENSSMLAYLLDQSKAKAEAEASMVVDE